MQDPSAGVHQPLDKHVHLISSHPFPTMTHLSIEQAFRYLLEAPSVVKQVASMAWTYLQAPQDGTTFLTWQSPSQNGGRFPSDGYLWADPEQSYRQSFNGYTIEMMVHQAGFRPSLDHMITHARTRYHLIAKAPNVNAAPPDPSLWIVHYHQAPQQRILPVSQIRLDQGSIAMMTERKWLESLGRIERREFMLHDREHWPTITLPGQPNPGFHQGMAPQNRYGQPNFPQPAGTPNVKRQRVQGPGEDLETEDLQPVGDYFDHLTTREISLIRWTQHHQWMEEVFNSLYASANIVPADLGLGLMGELKGLTEGILQPPAIDIFLDKSTEDNVVEFTKIPKGQLEEFNNRVQKHIEEGKAEIERMKADHATKMREWRKTYKLTQAERQLRTATWKDHDSTILKYEEVEQPAVVEAVLEQAEMLVGSKIKGYSDAVLIDKGGLVDEPRQLVDTSAQQQSKTSSEDAVSFQHETNQAKSQPAQNTTDKTPSGEPNDTMDIDAGDLQFDLGDTPKLEAAPESVPPTSVQNNTGLDGADDAEGGETMFNESTFDFPTAEVGDGLIDFGDEDGMGIDDSAFGDAIHGMDS